MKNSSWMRSGILTRAGVFSALALALTTSASAIPVTFAQVIQTNGATQQWSVTTSGGVTTITASGSVQLSFSGVSGLPFAGAETANFTLSATSSQIGNCGVACGNNDSYDQKGYAGTFSYIDADSAPGVNLLSGTFAVTGSPSLTGADFGSNVGSSGGNFTASSAASNLSQLILTSAYLDFTGQTQENASWALSSLVPNFTVGTVTAGQAFPGTQFNASASATFSSNPGPVSTTPEPATFALFGSALAGLALLRTKRFTRS